MKRFGAAFNYSVLDVAFTALLQSEPMRDLLLRCQGTQSFNKSNANRAESFGI
jgi:hypothetical protein